MYSSITIDKSGKLKWSTKDEGKRNPFIVEQYFCNHWEEMGRVYGEGGIGTNEYEYEVEFYSKESKFRVRHMDSESNMRISEPVLYKEEVAKEVIFKPKVVNKEIEFSEEGYFQIYSTSYETVYYFEKLMEGRAKTIDCSELKRGAYYIFYDNKIEKFLEK